MITALERSFRGFTLLAAGLVVPGADASARPGGGFSEIVICALLGAFCGLLFGLVTAKFIRYGFFLCGRDVSMNAWTTGSVLLGALLFIWQATASGCGPEIATSFLAEK